MSAFCFSVDIGKNEGHKKLFELQCLNKSKEIYRKEVKVRCYWKVWVPLIKRAAEKYGYNKHILTGKKLM